MKTVFLLVALLMIILFQSCLHTGTANERAIKDALKTYFKSNFEHEIFKNSHYKLDTLNVLRIENISERELLAACLSEREDRLINALDRVRSQIKIVEYKKREIVEYWENKDDPYMSVHFPQDYTVKRLKQDSTLLSESYSNLKSDSLNYVDLKNYTDSLKLSVLKADTSKKDNFLVWIHCVTSSVNGHEANDELVYLSKNYKIRSFKEIKD